MSELAISIRDLGKRYRLHGGGPKARYSTLRDAVTGVFKKPFRRREPGKDFWALRNVSFDVRRGDVVGVIGRNGAGKSTLLKILSLITDPTEGEADIHGRVGSLLEVGTGFHPELTGRENVYLNGSILGMRRSEIARQFDAIVSFAEVEEFIDTPVKFYSSGMYTRLAFAVAAHLETDILIVDEVLAVGDAAFQKKCLGKMNEVARGGRTVLFVSHNMQTISALCNRSLCLHRGSVVFAGSVVDGIARYYAQQEPSSEEAVDAERRPGSGGIRIVESHPRQAQFQPHEPKIVDFTLRRSDRGMSRCLIAAHVVDEAEQLVCQCNSVFLGREAVFTGDAVSGSLVLRTPWLKPGDYWIDLFLLDGLVGVVDRFERACRFTVLPVLPYPSPGPEASMASGAVLADFDWTFDLPPTNGVHPSTNRSNARG
jgi:lipopolysaccharide transport system ATP-binding protein